MGRVDVEWRKGADGLGGTYSFNPRPSLDRPVTGQKLVEFKIPLMVGSITQLLKKDSDKIKLRGVLVEADVNRFDYLDLKRRNLIAALDVNQLGQLHIISNLGTPESEHIFYRGVVTAINFREQTNSQLLDYEVDILVSDALENVV